MKGAGETRIADHTNEEVSTGLSHVWFTPRVDGADLNLFSFAVVAMGDGKTRKNGTMLL